MTQELIEYHKTKMRLAEAEGRTDDYKFHKAAVEQLEKPSLPSNLGEAAIDAAQLDMQDRQIMEATNDERLRYSRIFRRGFKAGAEWMAGQGWHDITETPSIFGFYLVIHEKGWCVANYMGKGTVCESGWVEAIHHIEVEHPQKWLDLGDLIPKKR